MGICDPVYQEPTTRLDMADKIRKASQAIMLQI